MGNNENTLHLKVFESVKRSQFKSDEDVFMICPRSLYANFTAEELSSMKQLYQVAYDNARAKIMSDNSMFLQGGGI